MLASNVRADRMANCPLPEGTPPPALPVRILIIDLLLKFSIFKQPESEEYWLLPSDIPSPLQIPGLYRQNRKIAIDELGSRTMYKKWQSLVPMFASDKMRKSMVWRDGMGDHILGLLRVEARMRLYSIPKIFLFHANVDANLTTATVGHRIEEHTFVMDSLPLNPSILQNDTVERKTSEVPSTIPPPPISAILYLGSPDLCDGWEFKTITVEDQSTQAVLINLRRLFPIQAEHFLTLRTKSGNGLAVRSSEITGGMLRHLLRLALYIEGDKTANMTLEESEEYERGRKAELRGARHGDSDKAKSVETLNKLEKNTTS